MLSVGKVLPQTLEIGLACAGLGFGTVMPSVIKAVIGSIDQRDAGLASGIVITTFQVGAALGVAIISGVFYSALGRGRTRMPTRTPSRYRSAATWLLTLSGVLSLWLPGKKGTPGRTGTTA
jgi:predicted MFS family arabinose efflux permease